MEILNIGPLELILIVLIALVVLGPNETVKAMRKLGRLIYRVAKSPYWSTIMNTSKEIRDLPNMIVREAGLDESISELKKTTAEVNKDLKDINKTINDDVKDINKTITKDIKEINDTIKEDEIISRKDIPKIELNPEKETAKSSIDTVKKDSEEHLESVQEEAAVNETENTQEPDTTKSAVAAVEADTKKTSEDSN